VDLAASVADGTPIDWKAFDRDSDAVNRRLASHLRLVESIASLHRSIPQDDAFGSEPEVNPVEEPSGPHWGRLVMLDRIGEGTSCEVYRAWDSALHREVALKLLHDEGSHADSHARLLDEARRMARVRHPHVVQVYGAEQHGDRVGLWMELVRGESLEQLVNARGPFGSREAALVGLDLCAALAAVHGAGLLHRDIKAQNVMRENGGRVVLMDFGTGELLTGTTNRLVGTPLYLAPEIFRGQKASVQSDLYSLGVLLFYLVTGRFPVRADTMEQLARAHADRQRRSLRDLRPDAPEPFVRAIERALDNDPTRRYHSVGEMESALREAVAETPSRVVAPAPVVERRPARTPRWIVYTCAAIAAVVVLLVGAWALTKWTEPDANTVGGGVPTIASVAVLPLTDQSETPSPSLAAGLTDQLINTVGQIGSLRVTSPASVMTLRGATRSSREIGTTLGVDAVLESSMVRVRGGDDTPDRVRINARLVMAGTDTLVWSRSFERQLGDMLALQAEIARAIAEGVKAIVTPGEAARLQQTRRTTPAAEEAYLAGRYHLGQYGLASAEQALEAFTRASQLDQSFAAALAGAARARFALGFGGRMSHMEARALALADVQQALRLEPNDADAHATLGDLRFYYDWDWIGAEAEYQRAIALNSSFSYARSQYARFLAAEGRLDEAGAQAAVAAELDPLSVDVVQSRGLMEYYRRDFAAAAQELQRAIALDPQYARAHFTLGRVREAEGRIDDAIAETTRAIEMASEAGASWRMQLLRLRALAGKTSEARAAFAELSRELERKSVRIDAEQLAYFELALGDQDRGLTFLERAVDERQPSILWLAVDPRLDSVRSTPRFQALVAKLGRR
jgi:TolB-like protein/Tfp pilus assembly protein PilF